MTRTFCKTIVVVLTLAALTGCCTPRQPVIVPRPELLATPTLTPAAIANRTLTSILMLSPLATAPGLSRLHLPPPREGDPEIVLQAMELLRHKLDHEPRILMLDSPTKADYVLQPRVDDATLLFEMRRANPPGDVVWRHNLPLR